MALGAPFTSRALAWEAFMFAHQYKLDNLCAIIDNNGLQIDGRVEDVMSPYPIVDKLKAFGWEVAEIDGHDFEQMESAFAKAREVKGWWANIKASQGWPS